MGGGRDKETLPYLVLTAGSLTEDSYERKHLPSQFHTIENILH